MNDFFAFVVFICSALALVLVPLLGIGKVLEEASCNQTANQLRGYGVKDGDYRLLSDACWLTMKDGRKIQANQLRALYGRGS